MGSWREESVGGLVGFVLTRLGVLIDDFVFVWVVVKWFSVMVMGIYVLRRFD